VKIIGFTQYVADKAATFLPPNITNRNSQSKSINGTESFMSRKNSEKQNSTTTHYLIRCGEQRLLRQRKIGKVHKKSLIKNFYLFLEKLLIATQLTKMWESQSISSTRKIGKSHKKSLISRREPFIFFERSSWLCKLNLTKMCECSV